MMTLATTRVVIIGAGPAGIRAAETLAQAGLRPILVDEGRLPGGQGYRRPSAGLALDMDALLGTQAAKYRALHARFAELAPAIDYRPETLAWAVHEGTLHVARDGAAATLPFDALLIAAGAADRVFPVKGWTLPGVFTLGGAQVILKDQGCLIGRRMVFLGSSPLLSLAALQYRQFGADVAAICDTTPLREKLLAAPALAPAAATALRGLGYLARLRRDGVPMFSGTTPLAIEGRDHVEAVRFRLGDGEERVIACDAVAFGYGLKPETQLAELAGARFGYDPVFRLWGPNLDADGRARPGLYLAGDCAAIGGADAAEASGTLAALALLADLGGEVTHRERRDMPRLRREVARYRSFQKGLARAFAWPGSRGATAIADEVELCRCENVTAGDIRAAIAADLGPVDVNRVKAITRCGMGRCQGRMCGPALQEIAAAASARPLAEVGRLRGQAPVKPLAIGSAAAPA